MTPLKRLCQVPGTPIWNSVLANGSTFNNISRAKSEGVKWVTNAEALRGFVTDKGVQDLHFYLGIGPVVSVGIPHKDTETKESRCPIELNVDLDGPVAVRYT